MPIVFPLHFPPTRHKHSTRKENKIFRASKATRRLLVAPSYPSHGHRTTSKIIRGLRAEAVLPQGTTWLYFWGPSRFSGRFRGFGAARSKSDRTPKGLGTVVESLLNRALTLSRLRRWLFDHLCLGARTFFTSGGGLTG